MMSPLIFRRPLRRFVVGIVLLLSLTSQAQINPQQEVDLNNVNDWKNFSQVMDEQIDTDERTGQAYMLSGGLLLLGGVVGYSSVGSSVEKLAYSVAQSLGVAGIGYGAYLLNVGGEERAFYQSVGKTSGLTLAQRDQLTKNYTAVWKERRRNEKLIRILSHSLVAAMNFYNASRTDQADLRQGLYVIGGVNAIVALSLFIEF